ncbi:MAG: 50S ribosomal protein L35 [Deltaproteobacteria bacterium]|nr:50S ribosomal protein L35 [Deltaproteobacteria bacterium]
MPKIRTNRGAAKRFRVTATGKIKRRKSGLRHILTGKSRKRKNSLGKDGLVSKGDTRSLERLLPYR